jgi:hypothetical protein
MPADKRTHYFLDTRGRDTMFLLSRRGVNKAEDRPYFP